MTDQELKDLVTGLAMSQKETDRILKEMVEERREAEEERRKAEEKRAEERRKIAEELAEERKKTEREIRQANKQLGELGNKFGSFTDGLAWPSLERMMYRDFGMNVVAHRHRTHKNGKTLELDVLAYDTGSLNEAYVIEVKSRLDQGGIDQILESIALLPRFFPPARDRKIYGMIAAVDIPENLYKAAIKEGLYIARISDGSFKLAVPRGFKPRDFGPAAEGNGAANGQTKKRGRKKPKDRE
ncbi:MAG: DUF3782 domain-containing protein [Blastocatellia bacterium]